MRWIVPGYSKSQIDKAGRLLVNPKFWTSKLELDDAYEIIENHRASHGCPLLILRIDLANRARKIDKSALIAQRTKRLSSIEAKLIRFPKMRLSHMQDIGGCRAVVSHVRYVLQIASSYERSRTKNKLLRKDDYVSSPRDSGYRGIHFIYGYHSDQRPLYNGLKIEIQIRSRIQHAWATAVETVDAFTGQALKGGKGEADWRRFFALMGTFVAMKEKTALVPNTPKDPQELKNQILDYSRNLKVDHHLSAYSAAMKVIEQNLKGARYFLLRLDTSRRIMNITGYAGRFLPRAESDYMTAEKEGINRPELDAVLVAVGSLAQLKRAYPNYFADTHVFLGLLSEAIA